MENLRGIALMIGGMAAFAVVDLMIKLASRTVPLAEIVLVQAVGGFTIFLALTLRWGHRILSPAFLTRPVLIRNAGEIVAVVGMTSGVALAELSTATALMQVLPLVVMLGAVLFLGETVGWRRWLSVVLGFVGVLMVLRPGGGIEPGLLWVLFGVAGLAARDVSTRAIDAGTSSLVLSVYSFGSIVPVALIWVAVSGNAIWPSASAASYLAVMVVAVSFAYFLVTAALRQGEVSAIIPFRYTRLVFAMVLAVALLGERPDIWVIGGALLIIGSGLYALLRERAPRRT